ncbi:hypothetical protein VPNG_07892 [Cytospora leucostoma]|uniref:Rhodopsin domain-containing protein n=1 Tax=Cytospora leucostoma TaxID=1230097 RepID=A0A423WGV9_9PEZI|nr:hypothetical protein VPNG_07892 [Cytospora leucostoma]
MAPAVKEGEEITSTVIPLAPRTEVHRFVWCAGIFVVLTAIWSGMRVYSRRARGVPLAIEDVLYCISVVSFYGFVISLFMEALYGISMCAVKWSMLFMLKRIFAVRRFEIVAWAIIGLQAGWLVMTVLIGFLICRPVARNWDPTVDGSCGNRIAGYTAVSVVNVVVDCLMLILPLPMIYNLQTTPGYKLGLFAIFSIGIVTIIFSAIRLRSLNAVDFDDFAYTIIPAMTWTTAESGVAILVASSALLRPVFDKVFRGIMSLSPSGSPRPSGTTLPYLRSQSKVKMKARREFVTVGDSDDNVEFGQVGPRTEHVHLTEIQAGDRNSRGALTSEDAAVGVSNLERNGRMTIVVQKEVEQTYTTRDV